MFLKFPTPNKEGENFHVAKVMNIGEKPSFYAII